MSELTLLYVHGNAIGYGRLGVKLAKALTDAGTDVYDVIDTGADGHSARMIQAATYEGKYEGQQSKLTNTTCWVSVPTHAQKWYAGQHVGIFTMYETNRLPESFRETLHEFDTVVVPSEQNRELFGAYHDNVRVVPLGVDPKDWHYVKRPSTVPHFRFLIGGSGTRKGTDLAFRAFKRVFGDLFSNDEDGMRWNGKGPEPRLVMKNPKNERFRRPMWMEMLPGRYSDADEIALYESAHCYLQPSRGEGFGLQPLQAIAQGIPTILTDAHGHAGFAHLGIGIGSKLVSANYFIYGPSGEWWEPDFEQLCEAIRDVYDDYPVHLEDAARAAQVVADGWTWSQTADAFVEAFDGALDQPYSGDGSWYEPTRRLYKIVVNELSQMSVAGELRRFEPGCDYFDVADVKRILFESGKLDPACLEYEPGSEDDLGLAPEQVPNIAEYRASHAYCPSCSQRLNSGKTKAQDVLDRLDAEDPLPPRRKALA